MHVEGGISFELSALQSSELGKYMGGKDRSYKFL
jgi:hypothetical protein